jgi:hypothetical protein
MSIESMDPHQHTSRVSEGVGAGDERRETRR